jgi:hypothetical protein
MTKTVRTVTTMVRLPIDGARIRDAIIDGYKSVLPISYPRQTATF